MESAPKMISTWAPGGRIPMTKVPLYTLYGLLKNPAVRVSRLAQLADGLARGRQALGLADRAWWPRPWRGRSGAPWRGAGRPPRGWGGGGGAGGGGRRWGRGAQCAAPRRGA